MLHICLILINDGLIFDVTLRRKAMCIHIMPHVSGVALEL